MKKRNLAYFESRSVDDFFIVVLERPKTINEEQIDMQKATKNAGSNFKCSHYKREVTVVLKEADTTYYNMDTEVEVDLSKCSFHCMEPLTTYYTKDDYEFRNHEGRIWMKFNDFNFKINSEYSAKYADFITC